MLNECIVREKRTYKSILLGCLTPRKIISKRNIEIIDLKYLKNSKSGGKIKKIKKEYTEIKIKITRRVNSHLAKNLFSFFTKNNAMGKRIILKSSNPNFGAYKAIIIDIILRKFKVFKVNYYTRLDNFLFHSED